MDFRGPEDSDYENVTALNRALVARCAGTASGRRLLGALPAPLAARWHRLSGVQRERLARTPLLLLSFREGDHAFWDRLLGESRPLFEAAGARDASLAALVDAALGYVWHLARLNPYSARLICGASLHWCERLAEQPLAELTAAAAGSRLVTLRAADDTCLWRKLLGDGVSADRTLRDAARISVLQRVLTGAEDMRMRPALAARRLDAPSRRVTDG